MGSLLHLRPIAPSPSKYLHVPGLTLYHCPDWATHTEALTLRTTQCVSAPSSMVAICSSYSSLLTSVAGGCHSLCHPPSTAPESEASTEHPSRGTGTTPGSWDAQLSSGRG